MIVRNAIFLGALIAAASCATAPVEEINESAAATLAKYERTGEVVQCLNLRSISSIQPVTETTFLVRVGAGDYYVNDVSGRCNAAPRISTRLEYETTLSQLCRNELIRVVDNTTGAVLGGCGLGSFEKLEKKPTSDE